MNYRRRGRLWVPEAPGIIHRSRWMEGQDPVVCPAIRFSGHLTVELIEARSGFVKRRLDFPNLIVNAGLDGIGNGTTPNAMTAWAGCGTGSTAPANTDTSLQTEIAPASSNRTNSVGGGTESATYVGGPPDYWELSRVREFSTTQANGNLTEIGFFTASSAGTMWMRQLFKDGTGTPTTIVKTSADILRVTYKIRVYPPSSDVSNTLVISGTTYTWTVRALSVNQARAWGWGSLLSYGMLMDIGDGWAFANMHGVVEDATLVARTATVMNGSNNDANSASAAAYTTGNFYRDITGTWTTGNGNFATGIGGVTYWLSPIGVLSRCFQQSWSPKFAKDNTKQLTLTQRLSWARYP